MIGVTFAVMNGAPDLSKRELTGVATEGPVGLQSGAQTLKPSNSAGPLMQDSRPTKSSEVGAFELRPDAMTAPARGASLPAGREAVADAPPQPASFGWESVAARIRASPGEPGARAGSPPTGQPRQGADCRGAVRPRFDRFDASG
jgi:hypothetical protein